MEDLTLITLAALVTALATGLGALPLARFAVTGSTVAIASAVAAGLMLSASGALLLEGFPGAVGTCALGTLAGVAMVVCLHRYLDAHPVDNIALFGGKGAQRSLMIMLVMTVHSAAEGVGIGVSFADGAELGVAIAIAMAVHNIPEGLAISLVLVPQGVSVWRAALLSIASSLPQPLAAVPAFLFVQAVDQLLPAGLGFAAGAMIALVVVDILPEAAADGGRPRIAVITVLAFVAMSAFQLILR